MGVGGQRHAPAALYSRERLGTHCIGGWVDPRAGLDSVRKISPPPVFDPRTVQPVESRYTDWAIAAHLHFINTTAESQNKTSFNHDVTKTVAEFKYHLKNVSPQEAASVTCGLCPVFIYTTPTHGGGSVTCGLSLNPLHTVLPQETTCVAPYPFCSHKYSSDNHIVNLPYLLINTPGWLP